MQGVREAWCKACHNTPTPLTGIPLAHEAEELLGPGSPRHPLQEVLQGQRQLLLWGDSGWPSAGTLDPQPPRGRTGTEPHSVRTDTQS